MRICKCCGIQFPLHAVVDGRKRNLKNRQFCLTCSPFGVHNTRDITAASAVHRIAGTPYCSHCGTTDPANFYPNGFRYTCRVCQNQRVAINMKARVQYAKHKLGGKCQRCGYDRCADALDIHHVDPQQKDPNFKRYRGWKQERIDKELAKCVLLCRNCHAEQHATMRKEDGATERT